MASAASCDAIALSYWPSLRRRTEVAQVLPSPSRSPISRLMASAASCDAIALSYWPRL